MNLLEQYKDRLSIAEKFYSKNHSGEKLSSQKKIVTAKCLDNVNKFITEQFSNSVGTQRADMGAFKRFALNLTTVALPSLIANDIVIVHPMSSFSGYVTYLDYCAGSTKGSVNRGHSFNSVFGLGANDGTYTSSLVGGEAKADAGTGAYKATLNWAPVTPGTVEILSTASETTTSYYDYVLVDGKKVPSVTDGVGKIFTAAGLEVSGASITYATGEISFPASTFAASTEIKANYAYDNVVIPQNDLPTLNVEVKSIALTAKARRIAVYFSNMAAFQAKTDYGFDMTAQLASQAVGQLAYEIDTEVVNLLANAAGAVDADLTWNKALPVGVSKLEHFAGFAEILEIAKQKIYDRTRRFVPNYMLIASDILPVLSFVPGWIAANVGAINGPYLAGTINGVRCYVCPGMAASTFVVGLNGDDMQSSAAVYAPYMPIVPTQLLQFADGGTTQGFSTLYALEILNPNLVVKGQITNVEFKSMETLKNEVQA